MFSTPERLEHHKIIGQLKRFVLGSRNGFVTGILPAAIVVYRTNQQ